MTKSIVIQISKQIHRKPPSLVHNWLVLRNYGRFSLRGFPCVPCFAEQMVGVGTFPLLLGGKRSLAFGADLIKYRVREPESG